MSLGSQDAKKKSILGGCFLIFILITTLSVVFAILIDPIWWLLLPLSFSFLIIVQLSSRYFWLEKKTCPRCNAPVGKYSEFCRNCGLKLMFRCISCGKYMRAGAQFCDNCNIELEHTEEEREIFEYQIIEKDSPLPENPNFCANCGAEIKNPGMIKFCEECGSKLK
jgi:predicted amidophosphoribosyltransferase